MNKFIVCVLASIFVLPSCTSSRQTLADINPTRRYLVGVHDLFEAIREQSQTDEFHLDRFTEEAGRIIGHKVTSSSSKQGREFSTATTAMMVIMNIKVKKIEEHETEMVVNFSFESGHGTVTREEEEMLLECYNAILGELDAKFTRTGVTPAGS